jgi:hypothetical protein
VDGVLTVGVSWRLSFSLGQSVAPCRVVVVVVVLIQPFDGFRRV